MLTMEQAAAIALAEPAGMAWLTLSRERQQEQARRDALALAAKALRALQDLGLRCGVFGSALRPGDFLAGSDVDVVAWREDLSPLDPAQALAARSACHEAFGGACFDLVLLPCANEAFGQRLLAGWSRGLGAVERASLGLPMGEPLFFGPADVAFIDADRLDIAARAAARMRERARLLRPTEPLGDADLLTMVAGAQTVARVAEKCAKDALRELCPAIRHSRAQGPFYPLLAYPCEALGGQSLASEASVALFLACLSRADPREKADAAWALDTAAICGLFSRAMREALEPALERMARLPAREIA